MQGASEYLQNEELICIQLMSGIKSGDQIGARQWLGPRLLEFRKFKICSFYPIICYFIFLKANFLSNRYSDFLVNEIDPNGVIVKLTDLSEPVDHSLPPQVSRHAKNSFMK